MFNAFSNFPYILAILKHREGYNHSIFPHVSLLTLHGMEIKFYSWKKSHTCKEGGAYLKICLAFIDKLENIYLLKKLLKWANKPCKNFNIYNVVFKKKQRKTPGDIIILHLCTKNLDDMIYSSWHIVWQTKIGN